MKCQIKVSTCLTWLACLTWLTEGRGEDLFTISLSLAYARTAEVSEQIRSAKEALAQAELLPGRAMSRVAPQLSLGGQFIRQKEVLSFGSAVVPADQQIYSASLNWPLMQFEFFPRLAQGTAVIDAKRATVDLVTQRTLHATSQLFYQVLKAQRLAGLAADFERQAQEHFSVASSKFEHGEVRKTVKIQAELDVEKAKKRVIEQENALKVAKEELRSALGISLQEMTLEEPALPGWPEGITPQSTLEDLVAYAIAHRPDVLQARLEARSAWADRDAAFTRVLPTVGLQGNYSVNDPQTLFSLREQWRVGAVVTIPLFQGGEEWLVQVERASQARQAELVKEALFKQVEIEVKRAFYAWQVLEKNLQVLKKQVDLSRENYRMVESQFKEQLASSAEVTDAHVALMNTEVELAQEEYNYHLAVLTLLKTLGVFYPLNR